MNRLIVTTSWDDGTVTDLKLAELLNKYGIKGTFYIARSYQDNLLQEQDIVELNRQFECGAHTLDHPNLTKVPLPQAKREIENSKIYLENLLGHAISMFCYSYGKYNEDVKKAVKDSGFIAARTSQPGGFKVPKDPYQWHITLFASNGSPLMALKVWRAFHLQKIKALLDWEIRAKLLFDLALQRGGIYHIYGHSVDFEKNHEWDKLQRVLGYISDREGVVYITNGEVFKSGCSEARFE